MVTQVLPHDDTSTLFIRGRVGGCSLVAEVPVTALLSEGHTSAKECLLLLCVLHSALCRYISQPVWRGVVFILGQNNQGQLRLWFVPVPLPAFPSCPSRLLSVMG